MECSLYLAPSTIPNAGLGIFTAKELHHGDSISNEDVAIPILDLEWHNAAENDYDDFPNPFHDYVWSGRAMGMSREGGDFEAITLFWPGLDAAVNSFPLLNNLERSIPDYDPDLGGNLHRSRDESVGSFTPYIGTKTYVKHFVPAGGELFKDYGDDWFRTRDMTFPVISDIAPAVRMLGNFPWRIHSSLQPALYELLLDVKRIWDGPPILQVIPNTWDEAEPLIHHGLVKRNTTITQALRNVYQPDATRSISWLKENGSCLDRIRAAPSTIKQAGRGAFAKQSFQPGDIITTSPVIHVKDKDILNMHHIGQDAEDETKFVKHQKIGTQIIANYCFSHPSTTLALCPYAAGVNLINHSREIANVRLQWPSANILNHHASFLTIPPEEWGTLKPQLALNYIAARPIAAGEELFLDYGDEWQEKWEEHRRKWYMSELVQPVPQGEDYISASVWNRLHSHNDTLWTEAEISSTVKSTTHAPPFLELRCHSWLATTRRNRYNRLKWDGDWTDGNFNPEYGRPCRVIARHEESGLYDIEMQAVIDEQSWELELIQRKNVPRRLIRWFDKPHTTDPHLTLAFRHIPGLPDELVSKGWRNIPTKESRSQVPRVVVEPPRKELVPIPGPTSEEKSEATAPKVATGVTSKAAPEIKSASDGSLNSEACPANDEAKHSGDSPRAATSEDDDDSACALFLAPSTISGAGLGIFAGKDYSVGEGVGEGDVVIPVRNIGQDLDFKFSNMYEHAFEDYVWDFAYLGLGLEDTEDVGVYWPGINAAVNCYPALINLRMTLPEQDSMGLHRFRHPGAGAMSQFHKGISRTTAPVPAGGEIFKDYGPEYFLSRDAFDGVPVAEDFDIASEILAMLYLLDIKDDTMSRLYDLTRSVAKLWGPRVFAALPDTYESALTIIENLEGQIGLLHQPNTTLPLGWLEDNGRCIDVITPKMSTIDGAGYGAFAKRSVPKGKVLTGSSLLHIRPNMLSGHLDKSSPNRSDGYNQLLMNYCFGHPNTSLLLCPYSTGVNYINHNKSQANLRIKWTSDGALGHNESYLHLPPWHFDYMKKVPLAIDYVATKDIRAGEELFLDYGDHYEEAWAFFVREWEPSPDWASYMPASQINDEELVIRTADEQISEPYPDNVMLHCHSTLERYSMDELEEYGVEIGSIDHLETLFAWVDQDTASIDYGYPCEVVKRHFNEASDSFVYDVRFNVEIPVEISELGDDKEQEESQVFTYERVRVPRPALKFLDRQGTTDMYLKTAFRHAIGLPDDMLPDEWRDQEL